MKTIYTYDGTFHGFLTCLHVLSRKEPAPFWITEETAYEAGLFDQLSYVATDERIADGVYRDLKKRLLSASIKNITRAFLSSDKKKEKLICDYIQMAFKEKNVDLHLSDDRVIKVHDLARKVGLECHRMQGLLRFKELSDGIYYARMATDHFVLPLIAPYFTERLCDRSWVIHDEKRKKAALYNKKYWEIADIEESEDLSFSKEEQSHQILWKNYFQHIGIKERTNPKLQKRNMPARYWKHLVEMQ